MSTRGAVLAAGAEALASNRTAALLWHLDGVHGRIVEVTVPYSEKPIPKNVVLHGTRRSLPGEVVDGIQTTSVERTLLDLARYLPDLFLEKAVMSALRHCITARKPMDDCWLKTVGGVCEEPESFVGFSHSSMTASQVVLLKSKRHG